VLTEGLPSSLLAEVCPGEGMAWVRREVSGRVWRGEPAVTLSFLGSAMRPVLSLCCFFSSRTCGRPDIAACR